MAGKAGSAADLIEGHALLLAAQLGEAILALRGDPPPETVARVEKLSRAVKLAADAGKAVVAMEAAASKARSAETAPVAPVETDADETDMDDPDAPTYTLDEVERMRERIERRIAEVLGATSASPHLPAFEAHDLGLILARRFDLGSRREQRPPDACEDGRPWRTWLLLGGRGAGKTRAGAEWIASQALRRRRLALVGPSLHDVREVMVEGPSGLRRLDYGDAEPPTFHPSRRVLEFANGALAHAFSAEDPESLRGPQFHAAWADEFCAWRRPGEILSVLRMGLRLGRSPRLAVTTTPRPIVALKALMAEPSTVTVRSRTADNAENLSPDFLAGLTELYGGTRLAAQELEGLVVEDEGALWRASDLARCRGAAPPAFETVVVAVDPPVTAAGDACGIVAVGREDGRAYVLEDASARGLSPLGWASRVAACAERWGASRIVAEANQGGEMVRTVLSSAGVGAPVKLVHAARSKAARAAPVAALYEQGKVTHCGSFPALEEELMGLGAEASPNHSPDRADALVWALTELMLGRGGEGPRLRWL